MNKPVQELFTNHFEQGFTVTLGTGPLAAATTWRRDEKQPGRFCIMIGMVDRERLFAALPEFGLTRAHFEEISQMSTAQQQLTYTFKRDAMISPKFVEALDWQLNRRPLPIASVAGPSTAATPAALPPLARPAMAAQLGTFGTFVQQPQLVTIAPGVLHQAISSILSRRSADVAICTNFFIPTPPGAISNPDGSFNQDPRSTLWITFPGGRNHATYHLFAEAISSREIQYTGRHHAEEQTGIIHLEITAAEAQRLIQPFYQPRPSCPS